MYHARALSLRALGQQVEALADIDRAIALLPDEPDFHLLRGNCLASLSDRPGAIAAYAEAARIFPEFVAAWYNRALTFIEQKDYYPAIRDLGKCIALEPMAPGYLIDRAGVYAVLSDFSKALADYEIAVRLNPRHPEIHFLRGHVLVKLDRIEEAVAAYDKSIALQPGLAAAYRYRGAAKMHLQRKAGAFEDFEKAAALGDAEAKTYLERNKKD